MEPSRLNKLSLKAFADLKAIVFDEISEPMTDTEIEAMGLNLLRLFSHLVTEPSARIRPKLDENEQRALIFITDTLNAGENPSVRAIAAAVGLKSSRSGFRLLDSLISKGWVRRNETDSLEVIS